MIIGITGRKGSGKSTFGAHVRHTCGVRGRYMYEYQFSAPLKEVCEVLFITDTSNWWGDDKDKSQALIVAGLPFDTYRTALQYVGTEVFRKANPDFWLHIASTRIAALMKIPGTAHIVITDVRFDNEAQWIRDRGGVVVAMTRKVPDAKEDKHTSEAGVSEHLINYAYDIQSVDDVLPRAEELCATLSL